MTKELHCIMLANTSQRGDRELPVLSYKMTENNSSKSSENSSSKYYDPGISEQLRPRAVEVRDFQAVTLRMNDNEFLKSLVASFDDFFYLSLGLSDENLLTDNPKSSILSKNDIISSTACRLHGPCIRAKI